MIIDKILDRKDGQPYTPRAFYQSVTEYGEVGESIATALDSGTENDVKNEITRYIITNGYNPTLSQYVQSVQWL